MFFFRFGDATDDKKCYLLVATDIKTNSFVKCLNGGRSVDIMFPTVSLVKRRPPASKPGSQKNVISIQKWKTETIPKP